MKPRLTCLFVGLILGLSVLLIAATTFTAPRPANTRTDSYTVRYHTPVEALLAVDVVSADVNDVSLAVDPNLCGYLQRLTCVHDGNDPAWGLTVTDAAGLTLFSDLTISAVTDPCSYVCDYALGGLPFAGGLTVTVSDANNGRAWQAGDGNNVSVRLYVRESFRR